MSSFTVEAAIQKLQGYVNHFNCMLPEHRLIVSVRFEPKSDRPAINYTASSDALISIICRHFDLSVEQFLEHSRVGKKPAARYMYLHFFSARYPELSDLEISRYIGRNDHSFVIYGRQKFQDFHFSDPKWRALAKEIEKEWQLFFTLNEVDRASQLKEEMDYLEEQLQNSDVESPAWAEKRDLWSRKKEELEQLIESKS